MRIESARRMESSLMESWIMAVSRISVREDDESIVMAVAVSPVATASFLLQAPTVINAAPRKSNGVFDRMMNLSFHGIERRCAHTHTTFSRMHNFS